MPLFQAVVLRCIDPRLNRSLAHYFTRRKIHHLTVAPLTKPGGCLCLAEPECDEDLKAVIRDLQKIHRLGVKEIILSGHTNCRAYAGRFNFADPSEEIRCHMKHIQAAAGIIRGRFPDVAVTEILAEHKGQDSFRIRPIGQTHQALL